jgi:hypothetical protein
VAVADRRRGPAVPATCTDSWTRRIATSSSNALICFDKKIRAHSHGNRQKVLLIAAFARPGRPAASRRADIRSRSTDGTGLPPACGRRTTEGRRCCCPRTLSEVEAPALAAMLRSGRIIETTTEVLRLAVGMSAPAQCAPTSHAAVTTSWSTERSSTATSGDPDRLLSELVRFG